MQEIALNEEFEQGRKGGKGEKWQWESRLMISSGYRNHGRQVSQWKRNGKKKRGGSWGMQSYKLRMERGKLLAIRTSGLQTW